MHSATNNDRGAKPRDASHDIAPDLAADIAAGERHLLDRIRHLLAWQFGVDADSIEAQTELVDHLYADSLDLMEMTHILNREFDIDIEAGQLADMQTVGGVERVVKMMLRDGDAGATLRN
jgi:acyl carrier protein